MIKFKPVKWSLGLFLVLGLSACMELYQPEQSWEPRGGAGNQPQQKQNPANPPKKLVQKTYATKDPSQKATPGPARKVAPQLPVIE